MGTWGMKSFENDTALDWAADLAESEDLDLVESSLDPPTDDGYLDSDDAVMAVAAAEVVAAALGKPAPRLPDDVQAWIARAPRGSMNPLVPKALAALDLVLGENSELRELWEENEEDCPTWEASIRDLRERLKQSTQ